ncbi:MAG: aldehyde dehydrogenase family protein, partial [Planctomycetes bacterium]|nr:aldehyde dehydrogenase family protein [Planctomycetota bacterium]
ARLAEIFAGCGAPPGAFNVVHGVGETAEALLSHPDVRAVSVVGSSPVARKVYTTAATCGKRVQALGGAKNALIVLPDCDLPLSVDSIISSVFGCAGQRCLAGSNVVAVGSVAGPLLDGLASAASRLRLGSGLDPQTTMGPVISPQARERVLRCVDAAVKGGATIVRDGRKERAPGLEGGYFIGPTILDGITMEMPIAREEVFGPVLGFVRAPDLEAAVDAVNGGPFGNSASIYTRSAAAVRAFRQRIEAGMLGVNVGVPAPPAFFPFSGWKDSFFGDLHAQGRDAVEFYTRRKVVTARWP